MRQHQPTEATRAQVEALAGVAGFRHAEIATFLGVSEKTLRKHYAAELRRATVTAVAKVAETLFQKAVNGDVTAMIFWLKTRAGWSDKPTADSGHDAPLPTRVVVEVRPTRVTREAL